MFIYGPKSDRCIALSVRKQSYGDLSKFIYSRVALAVPACQPGWEEMENLRGNLGNFKEILGTLKNFEMK